MLAERGHLPSGLFLGPEDYMLMECFKRRRKNTPRNDFFFLIFSSSFKFEAQLTLISIPGCWWLSADKEELIFFFSSIHRIFSSVFFTDFVNKYLDSTKKNIHTAQKSTRVLCGSYLTTGATQKLSLLFHASNRKIRFFKNPVPFKLGLDICSLEAF